MRTLTLKRLAAGVCGVLAAVTLVATPGSPSATAGPAPHYAPVVWPDEVSGKNFPLFAMMEADGNVHRAIADAPELRRMLDAKRTALTAAVANCGAAVPCHVAALSWSHEEIAAVRKAIGSVADTGALTDLVARMRRSGLFARDAALDDRALLETSWDRAAAGVNNILAVYGLGETPRYPAIDAISHDAHAAAYGQLVHTAMGVLGEQAGAWDLFFQPARALAMRLLALNYRDEAGRYEPMHTGENAAAFARVATVRWSDYPYTVALVPGAGLSDAMEREHHALNPMGRLIVELAARRYRERRVAFIIVSGGHVHPKHSRFAEAIEMKRALMETLGVPEDAVIVDPHARHTTTNVRNAARLMFRYGIPTDRPALITTQQYHLDSIASTAFDERNDRELGYRPYLSKHRLSRFELEWVPNVMSLHADPLDPLDP